MKYEWNIDKVDTIKFWGGQYDVVSQVEWHRTATDGQWVTCYYGVTTVPTEDLRDFVPYDQLTNEIISQWLNDLVDVPWVDSILNMQIQQLQTQQTTTQIR